MFGTYFYHERIRRSVGAFGSLFNNLYIVRKNASGGGTSSVKVPLAFAPKRKFIDRLIEDLKNEQNIVHKISLTLPRSSFEIVGIQYDPSRQLPRTQFCTFTGVDDPTGSKKKVYTKTPYNIQFQLNIYGKNHDDCLQVVEQILPYFTPTYTLRIKPFDSLPSVVDDIPLTLNSVSFTDDFEGTLEQRRTIIYTLDFEMKMDLYGPVSEGKIIKQADINLFLPADSDEYASGWAQESIIRITTDPADVSPDSDYTYVETILKASDGDSL